jgi:hypothetical protein
MKAKIEASEDFFLLIESVFFYIYKWDPPGVSLNIRELHYQMKKHACLCMRKFEVIKKKRKETSCLDKSKRVPER